MPLHRGLEERSSVSFDPQTIEVQTRVEDVKRLEADKTGRTLASVFDRFWQETFTPPIGGRITTALEVREPDGNKTLRNLAQDQAASLDRTDPVWKGTMIDSGLNEVCIVVTRINQDGSRITSLIKVSPFQYSGKDGSRGFKLKPDAIRRDDPNRGAIFRNKQTLS